MGGEEWRERERKKGGKEGGKEGVSVHTCTCIFNPCLCSALQDTMSPSLTSFMCAYTAPFS